VAVVDHRHQGLDPLEVLRVLRHIRPRRHQLGHEGHVLVELRVLLQEQVEGREPTQHVLGQVGPIDADDQVLAPAPLQLLLELADPVAPRVRARRGGVDRERVGAHPRLMAAVVPDDAAVEVDVVAHQVSAALQEVPPVGARVEADDVVGQEAVVDLGADVARQHPPGVGLRPWDVDEVVQERIAPLAPHQRRQRVEVVVVDHHDRLVTVGDLVQHRPRQVLVDDVVAELERLDLVAPDVRRVGQVPQVVLDEPQHRVREHVVEAVVGVRLGGDELDPVLRPVRRLDRERPAVVARGHLGVLVGQRRRHPDRVAMGGQAGQRRDQPASATLDLSVGLERDRPSVRDEDEVGAVGCHRFSCRKILR
jgi:hypothetical protein